MRSTIFFDIGGVFLTNAWDRPARERTTAHFGVDWEEFEARHRAAVNDFETGRLSLDAYLDLTTFYERRTFTRDAVIQFMFDQSQPYPEAVAVLAELARCGRYFIAALNNESRELNQYRIERFRLRDYFRVFLSSCYLGIRKPDARMYGLALDITQRRADDSVFVDDRVANVEAARTAGFRSVLYERISDLQNLLR